MGGDNRGWPFRLRSNPRSDQSNRPSWFVGGVADRASRCGRRVPFFSAASLVQSGFNRVKKDLSNFPKYEADLVKRFDPEILLAPKSPTSHFYGGGEALSVAEASKEGLAASGKKVESRS